MTLPAPTDDLITRLRAADPPTEDQRRRLRDHLATTAEQDGVLDLAYATCDSPFGALLLVATPVGLVRVAYAIEDHDAVLARLAERLSPRILRAPRRLDGARRQLDDYFAGHLVRFDLPLDHALSSGFRGAVQQLLPSIGYGSTRSYAEVAALAGRPTAVRAVGSACATNPLPILVPCHRVLRSDGTLGGYVGGLDAKTALLELEGAGGAVRRPGSTRG